MTWIRGAVVGGFFRRSIFCRFPSYCKQHLHLFLFSFRAASSHRQSASLRAVSPRCFWRRSGSFPFFLPLQMPQYWSTLINTIRQTHWLCLNRRSAAYARKKKFLVMNFLFFCLFHNPEIAAHVEETPWQKKWNNKMRKHSMLEILGNGSRYLIFKIEPWNLHKLQIKNFQHFQPRHLLSFKS